MRTSDLTMSIIIVIVFVLLYAFNVLVVNFKRIKQNWPVYRCNPLVMPFAALFGFNAQQNFTYCIQNMQAAYMKYLMQPLNYNMNSLANLGSQLTENVNTSRGMFAQTRGFITQITQQIFAVVFNMMIEMQRLMINMKDLLGKVMGTMATMLYLLSGSLMTMNTAWAGPPGQLVRALCFDPATPVQLQDGSCVPMASVPLGSRLRSGGHVISVMRICNVDIATGAPLEKMYRLPGAGEQATDIVVSGSHLVYAPEKRDFVQVYTLPTAEPMEQAYPELACLITSDNIIPLGQFVFHDWEDNNGSPSKMSKYVTL
jgi:hypothetical protein